VIPLTGEPADWVVHDGRPADWCGPQGMPSFERDDGLLVLDLLLYSEGDDERPMLVSRWYDSACVIAPGGLVPLYHDPRACWEWRPQLYEGDHYGGWQRLGSQGELLWRRLRSDVKHAVATLRDHGLSEHLREKLIGERLLSTQTASERAEKLLRENLTDCQQFEYVVTGRFHARGGRTRNLYAVRPGNGFELIDPVTHGEIAGYCLHPESWLPDADVALATKLALEDDELELDCLENARMGSHSIGTPYQSDWQERAAAERERELIT
jgi:hypothetical protein